MLDLPALTSGQGLAQLQDLIGGAGHKHDE
jgi:hypothetical protein